MKKLLSTLLISAAVFGGAQAVSADQTITAQTSADIAVKGTLGADNTNPGATIPEGDKDWINVTLPTDTIFYNKAKEPAIKAPTYTITNNSGRPVTVSVASFVAGASNPVSTLPADFDLNLDVTATAPAAFPMTAKTKLIEKGQLTNSTNVLFTLANNIDQYTAADSAGQTGKNVAKFTYSDTATATQPMKLDYTLSLKFDVVKF
jgi:hypothetical protein